MLAGKESDFFVNKAELPEIFLESQGIDRDRFNVSKFTVFFKIPGDDFWVWIGFGDDKDIASATDNHGELYSGEKLTDSFAILAVKNLAGSGGKNDSSGSVNFVFRNLR